MRINRKIRVPKVRVIGSDGSQLGIMFSAEALELAEKEDLDLVEVAPSAKPPVCKIINYGKFRYDQAKREKQQKKIQHHVKIKEVKVKPNISEHDLNFKTQQARKFIENGDKVKLTCVFRGREQAYPERGERVVRKVCDVLEDIAAPEMPLKKMGRNMITVIAPSSKGKKKPKLKPKENVAVAEA